MRSVARLHGRDGHSDEAGFTLVELLVALTIIAGVLVSLALLLTGALAAYNASKSRSGMNAVANAEMEALRAVPYDQAGVDAANSLYSTQYPGGKFQGTYDPVLASGASVPIPVTSVPPSRGLPAYTVERWVYWSGTDPSVASSHLLKNLLVRVTWLENGRVSRHIDLTSVLYPGGIGTPAGTNRKPVAEFTVSNSNPAPGTSVTLTSVSSDPDVGDTITVAWNFDDGATSTAATVTHAWASPGFKTVTLTVTDNHGAASTTSQTVAVSRPGDQAPTVTMTLTPSTGVAPLSVNANATGTDNDGDSLLYTWTWGDGSPSTQGVQVAHTYANPGTYPVTVTARDSSNLSGTASSSVVVTPLACDITSAYFQNPIGNVKQDSIDLDSGNVPKDPTFEFTATTNLGCSSVSARLPYSSGTFIVNLANIGNDGTTATWKASANFPSGLTFNSGTKQTGEFWSPSSDGSGEKFPIQFSAK